MIIFKIYNIDGHAHQSLDILGVHNRLYVNIPCKIDVNSSNTDWRLL